MADFALSFVLTPIRWAGYAAFLVCMFAAFSVLALAIGPITLIAMMFDPNTPIWAPLAIVVAVILCIIPAVIVADAVDGSTGVSILDRVFDRRVQNKVADWVLGLAVAGAFIWYVRGGG